ncbi:hypothetical protein GCM10010869_27660 [Mesorhizobium tianshanense]|nr:hypothetical protein GCM10010869_27660 [Mesorhizobium tianshanense]
MLRIPTFPERVVPGLSPQSQGYCANSWDPRGLMTLADGHARPIDINTKPQYQFVQGEPDRTGPLHLH